MFDIKLIRENADLVRQGLSSKKIEINLDEILNKDRERRDLLLELDHFRNKKNQFNTEIRILLKEKQETKEKISSMKAVSNKIQELDSKVKNLHQQINDSLLEIPNLPHSSVPIGSVQKNEIIQTWGTPRKFDFKAKTHIELGEELDIIDFKRATKITGSNFILFKKQGALLERALYNFMLDVHTQDHYSEILPPLLVNRSSMTATGQLPKMEEDMYALRDDDLFLIPTAEVPVTNIHRDEILKEDQLPIYYVAYTPCFRREAGSYGKETKGMMRVHQFDKVEMVKFVKPEDSYDELEALVGDAEKIFQLLGLPYRRVLLASGDLSFAAAKCYDIEAYAAGVDSWLEVSSCSNFEDFQARRSNIKYKGKETKKASFVHTLNGSGVALARTVIALMENFQTEEGEILIPEALHPYMRGMTKISK